MKRALSFLLITSILTSSVYSDSGSNDDLKAGYFYDPKTKNASADAISTGFDMSLLGWGIGLAAVIATLVILIPPDVDNNNHSHCSSQ